MKRKTNNSSKPREPGRSNIYLLLIVIILFLAIFGLIKYSWDRKLELDNLRWEQEKEKIQIESQQKLQEETLKTELLESRIQECVDKVKADYSKRYDTNYNLLEKVNQEQCHANGEWNQECTLGYAKAWKSDNDKLKEQEREDITKCQELK